MPEKVVGSTSSSPAVRSRFGTFCDDSSSSWVRSEPAILESPQPQPQQRLDGLVDDGDVVVVDADVPPVGGMMDWDLA